MAPRRCTRLRGSPRGPGRCVKYGDLDTRLVRVLFMGMDQAIFDIFDAALAARDADRPYDFNACKTKTMVGGLVDEEAINALVITNGNIAKSASLLGIRRMKLRDWIDRMPEVQMCMADLRDAQLDDVEEMQFQCALIGDATAGRFLLQTVGKERGYVTRTEQTGKDGMALLPPSVDFSKLSTETLMELKEAMINAGQ